MKIALDKIPKKRRRVVQYLLDHPDQVVINGSETLSKKLSVDRSPLINACKDLGHKGFKEYRETIKKRIINLEHNISTNFFPVYNSSSPHRGIYNIISLG